MTIKYITLIVYTTIAFTISGTAYDAVNLSYNTECVINWLQTGDDFDSDTIRRRLNFVRKEDFNAVVPRVEEVKDFFEKSPFKSTLQTKGDWPELDKFYEIMLQIQAEDGEDIHNLKGCQILTVHVTTALINLCMVDISAKKRQALKPFQEQWQELISAKKAVEE